LALISTWSRRKREQAKALSGTADVYYYSAPSQKLREQVRQLISGNEKFLKHCSSLDAIDRAVTVMRKELGRRSLIKDYDSYPTHDFYAFILSEPDVDAWLSTIEVVTKLFHSEFDRCGRSKVSSEYVAELNAWMIEDAFGYQIQNLEVIQISNEYSHSEITLPALNLLSEARFAGANSEFRQAHAEFRAGEYEDCIHDCCNAFESVLKVILDGKGWQYNQTDTAKKLLDVVFANNLIPAHMQNSFAGLRTILESGVPTVRNKTAGHGTGANPRVIPSYIAAFQLHQTAAAILLLSEASK
jgi:hypothetical protein